MRARKIAPRVLALVVSTFWLVQAFGQTRAIDTHNSKLIVHVSKTGRSLPSRTIMKWRRPSPRASSTKALVA